LVARFYYLLGASHRHFGNLYVLKSEYDSAVRAFSRAIETSPGFARAYLERGILYWRETEQPRLAIEDLTTAYRLDDRLSEARFNRGVAHQQLREYEEALADFRAYLVEGQHPYWREHAEKMIQELEEWVSTVSDASPGSS
jgi:tetratricopeptide (TPR) repeat protein